MASASAGVVSGDKTQPAPQRSQDNTWAYVAILTAIAGVGAVAWYATQSDSTCPPLTGSHTLTCRSHGTYEEEGVCHWVGICWNFAATLSHYHLQRLVTEGAFPELANINGTLVPFGF